MPVSTRSPSSLTRYTSTLFIGLPTEVGLSGRSSGDRNDTRLHSVRPYIEKIRTCGSRSTGRQCEQVAAPPPC